MVQNNIYVTSPYNSSLPSRARDLGGEWDKVRSAWKYHTDEWELVAELYRDIYGYFDEKPDFVTAIVTCSEDLPSKWHDSIYFAGLPVATAYDRDSGAKLGEGVIVIKGGFDSGGSKKNWRTVAKEGTIFKVKNVPINMIEREKKSEDWANVEIALKNSKEQVWSEAWWIDKLHSTRIIFKNQLITLLADCIQAEDKETVSAPSVIAIELINHYEANGTIKDDFKTDAIIAFFHFFKSLNFTQGDFWPGNEAAPATKTTEPAREKEEKVPATDTKPKLLKRKKSGLLKRKKKTKKDINLTDNEKAILKAGCNSEYNNICDGEDWVLATIRNSGLSPKVARGVIASLIKKGLVMVHNTEGEEDKDPNNMVIWATDKGVEVCKNLGFTKEKVDHGLTVGMRVIHTTTSKEGMLKSFDEDGYNWVAIYKDDKVKTADMEGHAIRFNYEEKTICVARSYTMGPSDFNWYPLDEVEPIKKRK